MAWTICPKCGARIEWAYSCSQCGTRIPLFDPASVPKDEIESPDDSGGAQNDSVGTQENNVESHGDSDDTQAKQVARHLWQKPAKLLLALTLALGVCGAVVLGILWLRSSSSTPSANTSAPSVVTADATAITTGQALLNGNLTGLGTDSSVSVSFQWGTASGSYPNGTTVQSRAVTGAFSLEITGLNPGSTYYFRAKAVGDGTAYGGEQVFTTGTFTTSSGALPTWRVGDRWVYTLSSGGVESQVTEEVIGEGVTDGKSCWVLELSYSPPFAGFETIRASLDKSTVQSLHTDSSGVLAGGPFTITSSYSYQWQEGPYWPLTVGKEIRMVQTDTTTATYGSESQTDTKTLNYTFKVEGMEQITVSAGTFECFRVVMYGESGEIIRTEWYSDKAKHFVKRTVYENSAVSELKSYSV